MWINLLVELDNDKQELDLMVERLARSPRLAQLLRFLGDRYLSGDTSALHEYEIATKVFGRSAQFDPAEDAIARVEAHRLRKKLKLYYETEGRDNPVRIMIPAGTYTPLFSHKPFGMNHPKVEVEPERLDTPTPLNAPPTPSLSESPSRGRMWIWFAVAIALVGGLLIAWQRRGRNPDVAAIIKPGADPSLLPASVSSHAFLDVGGSVNAVRILTGYQGQPHIDPAGNTWQGDRFFDRGGGWHSAPGFVARTNDEFLFRMNRTGEFLYSIPLRPGTYELHLFFDETGYGPGLGGGEGSRTFSVNMNGQPLLPGFDIVSDAMGSNIADEKIIRDVTPDKDGKLNLEFNGVSGKAIINAIEVVPGTAHAQLPIRLTTQPTSFLDRAGNMWSPDNYFLGGQPSLQKPPVTGTNDPGLFGMERYGHFTYALPVDPRGTYTVTLYFAEFYFGPDMAGKGGVGSRQFNVICNGATLLNDFDIFKEAGSLHALTKTFHHLKSSSQGKLNLTFEPIANYANISAIEVIDESH